MASGIRIPLVSDWNPKGVNQAKRDFAKLETAGQKFAFGMKKAFVPAVAGLAALGATAAKFISAGEEAATSNARIRQVTESMGLFGEASGDVTKKLIEQAEATARLTGVDQNQIKQAQASLLTFGEIAKSADEMGGAFDRATQLTIDLAAAGFGSVETNAIQLGKALNDPIKGLSALSKSGVTFTEQEKELITTLVESGKQFEAQDMILKAIEKQVGGTGEATANATDKLKVGFSQMAESIGQALLPLVEVVIPVMIGLFEFMGDHTGVVIGLGIALGTIAATIVAINTVLKIQWAWTQLVTAQQWLLNKAMAANPIGLIIVAVAALIAIFVVLQKKFDIIGKAIKGMKAAFDLAWDGIKWVINKIIDALNKVISLLNKIPGIDIPELKHLGDEAEEAAEQTSSLVDQMKRAAIEAEYGREPMGRFEQSIRNVRKESDKLETTLGRVDVAFDPLNEGIETATTRLDEFFNALDMQDATDDFIEALDEIATKMSNVREGTQQWEDLQRDAYEALRDLRKARTDLDDSFFEVLKLMIDTGDLQRAITLMLSLIDLGGQVNIPTTVSQITGMGFDFPSFMESSAGISTITNNSYYMPIGWTDDDILESLQRTNRTSGELPVAVSSTTRN